MVRSILANRFVENYLEKLSNKKNFSFGLIIGQPNVQEKDIVIQLARTPEQVPEQTDTQGSSSEDELKNIQSNIKNINTISDVDPQLLVNHSLSVTRMIPASFYVLGVFVVGEQNIFDDNSATKAIKNLMQQIRKILQENKLFCGYPKNDSEMLILFYSSLPNSNRIICKSYDLIGTAASLKHVDWKFTDKPISWQLFETTYELDEVFPLIQHNETINVEENFFTSLEAINMQIENSVVFIQNASVDESLNVEAYVRDQQAKKEATVSILASLYLPAVLSAIDESTVEKYSGTVRYSGIVYSKVWAHPKNTLKDVQDFIRCDVIRSLASRIQMYCDDQTESANTTDNILVINEPPRRIFFDIPGNEGIQFSEYIFRGESNEIAIEQAKDILDLDIEPDHVFTNLETLPEYDDNYSLYTNQSTNSANLKPTADSADPSRRMYIIGVICALLVLIASLILHFIFR